jgi:hypothetical protein
MSCAIKGNVQLHGANFSGMDFFYGSTLAFDMSIETHNPPSSQLGVHRRQGTHHAYQEDPRSSRNRWTPRQTRKQAGDEYLREEVERVRNGKYGARSPEQIIAIGLSQARRDGVKLPVKKSASNPTRKQATRDEAASHRRTKPSIKRS